MHYIKVSLWIFLLSLIYATGMFNIFGFYPELLFLFSCIYSPFAKSFTERVIISLVCGILMSGLGGFGFVFSMLLVVYTSLFAGFVFRGKLFNFFVVLPVILGMTFIYDFLFGVIVKGFSNEVLYSVFFAVLVNGVFCSVLYPMIKKTFSEKERYIF